MFLPRFPKVPGAGARNAAVLNHALVLLWELGRYCDTPGTALGRTKIPPVPAPTPAVSPFKLTVNGNPVCI